MEVVDDSMKNLERLYKDKEMLSELKTRYEKLVTPERKGFKSSENREV